MATPSESMFSAFIPFREVLLFPMGGFVPIAPSSYALLPHKASLPWRRIWVQVLGLYGIHFPVRAEVQGLGPVLGRAAGIAHPVA